QVAKRDLAGTPLLSFSRNALRFSFCLLRALARRGPFPYTAPGVARAHVVVAKGGSAMFPDGGSPSPADQRGPSPDRYLDEFHELLRQARAGSAEAARRLYDGYREHVLHVVRRHL